MLLKIYQLKEQYILRHNKTILIDLPRHQVVYEFRGSTHGCLGESEVPVSKEPSVHSEFYGVPAHLLEEVGDWMGDPYARV